MQGRLSIVVLALLAGCVAAEEPEAPAAVPSAEPSPTARVGMTEVETAAPEPVNMPLVLDGSTGTGAFACVFPAQQCAGVSPTPGMSGIILESLDGRVVGGELVLSWTPASPATAELWMGFMTMGGEECDGIGLGMVSGTSPLMLAVGEMPRDLCVNEVVHLWVATDNFGGVADAAYYQVDVDQAFRVEGAFAFLPTA